MRSRGPGFRFHPTDEELIMYYLKRKVTRKKFHCDGIRVLDVYNFDPWDLPGKAHWTRDLIWYFFCPLERKNTTGKRINRCAGHGLWKATGKDKEVLCNGEKVGMIKSLIFHTRNPTQHTNWVMHEYKLWDEYLKQLGLEEDVFVLCVIFEKEGPGPRNGAQYGGPYRDEDWDDSDCDTDDDEADDELDNCGEDTDVVGALTQVHTDKGKSTVPNDFERADGYCVGSSSRTLPSDFDQSDIGVDQDITCEPSIPANEEKIYEDSEDVFRLDDFADFGVGAHGCGFPANQNIQLDDYLEMADCMDVSGPFEGSHDHDHIGPGQPSPSFGEYEPLWQDPQFFDWLVGEDFGDNVPYLNQHHHLASGPVGFGDQFFGENVPYLNPHHQFAQGPVAFVGQSLRENVSSLHGPQFAEDSVGLGVHGFEENVSHMNRHGQNADGSIGSHGQEASMNGQMNHHFDGVGTAAPFGIMQPPQSMPRGSPHCPS